MERENPTENVGRESLHRLPAIIAKICANKPIKLLSVAPQRTLELVSYGPDCAQITDWHGGYVQKSVMRNLQYKGERFLCIHQTIEIPDSEPVHSMVAISQHPNFTLDAFAPQGKNSLSVEIAYLQAIEDNLVQAESSAIY